MKKTEEKKLAKKVSKLVRTGHDSWEPEYYKVQRVKKDGVGLNEGIPEFKNQEVRFSELDFNPNPTDVPFRVWLADWMKVIMFLGFIVFIWGLIILR